MAETVSDLFSGIITVKTQWQRIDAQEIGSAINKKTAQTLYTLGDGFGEGAADIVYAETRTIPANGIDTIDCAALTQQTLEIPVPFTFAQIRVVRVVNNETTAGRYIYFGASETDPFGVFAWAVGPESEFLSVNYRDAWLVNAQNGVVRIANPSGVEVSYSIVLIGSAANA